MRKAMSKLLVLSFLVPGFALAHTGVGETTGLLHGLVHPLGGLDHMLAMVAVGLWAVQIGGRALWIVPCTFVGVMVLGGVLGFVGLPVPFVEEGILVSILILGILVAKSYELPLLYSGLLVGVFAIFHGYAHGAEMPETLGAAWYVVGFALATAMLHMVGIGIGTLTEKSNLQAVSRITGAAIAVSGMYLAIS